MDILTDCNGYATVRLVMEKSKLKRVVVEVEPQIHKRLKMKAVKLGLSLGAITRQWLVEEWLPEKKAAQQEGAKQ